MIAEKHGWNTIEPKVKQWMSRCQDDPDAILSDAGWAYAINIGRWDPMRSSLQTFLRLRIQTRVRECYQRRVDERKRYEQAELRIYPAPEVRNWIAELSSDAQQIVQLIYDAEDGSPRLTEPQRWRPWIRRRLHREGWLITRINRALTEVREAVHA